MTNKEYEARKKRIELENRDLRQKQKLKELKNKYRTKIKKPTTSKLALLAVFLICFEVLIFAECFMWQFQDSSALYALIGVPVAIIPTLVAYYSKSKAENTAGGITYEMAMIEHQQDNLGCQEEQDTESEIMG